MSAPDIYASGGTGAAGVPDIYAQDSSGKQVSTPHQYDQDIINAARKHNIDPNLLRQVGMQESGLGTSPNYNPKTGLDRDKNQGHGLWQLDPASGASLETLQRAASDPAFAADYAAGMISNALKRSNGDVRGALAIYNSGGATSTVGLSYADEVTGRTLDPMHVIMDAVDRVGPTGVKKNHLQLLSRVVPDIYAVPHSAPDIYARPTQPKPEVKPTPNKIPTPTPIATPEAYLQSRLTAKPHFDPANVPSAAELASGESHGTAGEQQQTDVGTAPQSKAIMGALQTVSPYFEAIAGGGALLGPTASSFQNVHNRPILEQAAMLAGPLGTALASPHARDAYMNIMHQIVSGKVSPEDIAEMNNRYGIFSTQNVQRMEKENPRDPVWTELAKHPTLTNVFGRGAMDFIGVSPEAIGVSAVKIARMSPNVSRGLDMLEPTLRAHPIVGKVIDSIERSTSMYGVVKQVARRAGGNPIEAEAAARSWRMGNGWARTVAHNNATDIYAHTTAEQAAEIEHVANGYPRNDTIPEPHGTPIAERADLLREHLGDTPEKAYAEHEHILMQADPESRFIALVTRRGESASLNGTIGELLGIGREGETLAKPMIVRTPEGEIIEPGSTSRVIASRAVKVAREDAANEIGVTAADVETLMRSNPRYLMEKLAEVRRAKAAIKNDILATSVEKTVTEAAVTRATQAVEREQKVTGEAQLAKEYADDLRSRDVVKSPHGDSEALDQRANFIRERGRAVAAARGSEVHSLEASGASKEAIEAAKAGQGKRVGDAVRRALFRQNSKLDRRIADLQERISKQYITHEQAQRFSEAFKRQFKIHLAQERDAIAKEAERVARGEGYVPASSITRELNMSLDPLYKYVVVDKEIANFLKEQGATQAQAGGFSAFLDGLNKLYRVGVITNPVRHVFMNLAMNYLAAGGDMSFFLHDLWVNPSEEDLAAARADGAIQPMAPMPLLGGDIHAALHAPMKSVYGEVKGELGGPLGVAKGIGGVVNAALSRAWAMNQRVVFDMFETRYAVALHKRFLADGKTGEGAGILTRKALGDYGNVSNVGIEAALNRNLMFYSWLRTVVPLYMRALWERPQWVWSPYADIQRWNQARNPEYQPSDSESQMYVTNINGQPMFLSWPGPQKYVDDILKATQALFGSGGIMDALTPMVNVGLDQLRPYGLGIPADVVMTMASKPTDPGAPNFHIIVNRDAPKETQIQQVGQYMLGKTVGDPVASAIEAPMRLAQGDWTAALTPLTLSTYAKPSAETAKALRKADTKYQFKAGRISKQIRQAQEDGDQQEVNDLLQQRKEDWKEYQDQKAQILQDAKDASRSPK